MQVIVLQHVLKTAQAQPPLPGPGMRKARQFDGQGIARPDIFGRLKNGTVEHADHAEGLAETKHLRRRELFMDLRQQVGATFLGAQEKVAAVGQGEFHDGRFYLLHQGLSLVSSWSVHAPLTEESCEREGSTEKFTIVFAIGSAKHRFAPVQVSGLLADEVT